MALARLALKKVQQRVISPSYSSSLLSHDKSIGHKEPWRSGLLNRLCTTTTTTTSSASTDQNTTTPTNSRNVTTVSDDGGKKSKLFSRKRGKRNLWRNNNRDTVPALWEYFPSGLGNALMQATDNINRILEKLGASQSLGRFKEKEECYKLKFQMPGIPKERVKITVEDGGILRIRGEHREESGEDHHEEEEEGEYLSSYGYYDTSMVLPEDAKVEEIKAEMKHGVLKITIPRSKEHKKDVKEVQVQ